MCWKIGMSDSTERPRQGGAGRRSIARRLALLHGIAVLLGGLILVALFYAKRVPEPGKESLDAEVTSVLAMMREPDGRDLLSAEIRTQQFRPEHLRLYLRILDPQGRALLENPGMEGMLPRALFPAPDGKSETVPRPNGKGASFLLGSFRIPDQPFIGPGAVLQVAMSIREAGTRGTPPGLVLVALVACGLFSAFCSAFVMARFVTKPLEVISQAARGITRSDLHARIDETELPTELLSLAHSLNGMLARLEDSFGRLSHYSANLAHELRSPINTLLIAADIALSRERSPEEYRAVIGSSLDEFGRISRTIDRMLFLARADSKRHDVARERLDAAGEVEDLFDFYSDSASDAEVALECRGTATLYADQTLFRRALSNLIENALCHTPPGGTISISVSQALDLSTDVLVSDTGCGIEARHLSKITDRFYRVEGFGAENSGGAGLGLAIVTAIMQMHGGSIAIESSPGSGTRVTLHFPPASVVLV